MTAYTYLLRLRAYGLLPPTRENGPGCTEPPSNGEIKRWLRKRSVQFDRHPPDMMDEVRPPTIAILFFPKGHPRCLMLDELPPFTDEEPSCDDIAEFNRAAKARFDAYHEALRDGIQRRRTAEHAVHVRYCVAERDAKREKEHPRFTGPGRLDFDVPFDMAGPDCPPRSPCPRCGDRPMSGDRRCGRCGLYHQRLGWWGKA